MHCTPLRALVCACVFLFSLQGKTDEQAEIAFGIIQKYCHKCHGEQRNGDDPQYDVANLSHLRANGYITPGRPGASKIMRKIVSGEMPPDGNPAPTAQEVLIIEDWIKRGAASPEGIAVPLTPEEYVLSYVTADLTGEPEGVTRNYSHFSLVNLPDDLVPAAQAALTKVVNSMSFKADLTIPKPLDERGLVMRIDRRDYGWDDVEWQRILNAYPYFEAPTYIRADWFIVEAFSSKKQSNGISIYYDLLDLPGTGREFEAIYDVDSRNNIINGNIVRAGPQNSGVAVENRNRIAEYHAAKFGSLWKTYDFVDNDGRQNILEFPLGPFGVDRRFDDFAFVHQGNEFIALAPNGLDHYFITNANDVRLDSAPANVVIDRNLAANRVDIFAGVSCAVCHEQGKQKLTDSVRFGFRTRNAAAAARAQRIYPPQALIDRLVRHDQNEYLRTVQAITGSTDEPIGSVAAYYNKPLNLATAAREAGASDLAAFRQTILVDPALREGGILPLAYGQDIPRALWQAKRNGIAPAKQIANQMRLQ